jgi:hypothetical protein
MGKGENEGMGWGRKKFEKQLRNGIRGAVAWRGVRGNVRQHGWLCTVVGKAR